MPLLATLCYARQIDPRILAMSGEGVVTTILPNFILFDPTCPQWRPAIIQNAYHSSERALYVESYVWPYIRIFYPAKHRCLVIIVCRSYETKPDLGSTISGTGYQVLVQSRSTVRVDGVLRRPTLTGNKACSNKTCGSFCGNFC